MLSDPLVSKAAGILRGSQNELPTKVSLLPFFAAAILLPFESRGAPHCSGLSPCVARLLYWLEVRAAADKSGAHQSSTPLQSAAKRQALVRLVAADAEGQQIAVTEAQVADRLQVRMGASEEHKSSTNLGMAIVPDDTVASVATIVERLQGVEWLPRPDTVIGLRRIMDAAAEGKAASARLHHGCVPSSSAVWYGQEMRENGVDMGALFMAAACIASLSAESLAPVSPAILDTPAAVFSEIRRLLQGTLREDHAQRLNKEVTDQLLRRRSAAMKQQAVAVFESSAPQLDLGLNDLLGKQRENSSSVDLSETTEHLSIVLCGPQGCGKSTLASRLLLELGRIEPHRMQNCKDEADRLGKASCALSFLMDTCRKERERGMSMLVKKECFRVEQRLCSLIDTPGHRDFLKHALNGTSQADVGVLFVPADGQFASSIAKGNHATGELEGQTRLFSRILSVVGVKQLIVLVNKMDSDAVRFDQRRFEEISSELRDCLSKTGWKKGYVILPTSGWHGDNLVHQSSAMPWWQGQTIQVDDTTYCVSTLLDALQIGTKTPRRDIESPLRLPVSGVFKIRGAGDVVTGRMEQGTLQVGDKVRLLAHGGVARVHSIETHHQRLAAGASAGAIVGVCLKGIGRERRIEVGDIMVAERDESLMPARTFTVQAQVLDHPGELKVGYAPLCLMRTSRVQVRLQRIVWKMGRETGGKKMEDPHALKANEMAEVVFQPQEPFCVDTFKNCDGFSRLLFFDAARGSGAACVMIGKVVSKVSQDTLRASV
jgi:elongation factor 1-alpha